MAKAKKPKVKVVSNLIIGDTKLDLISIFAHKDMVDMSDEELETRISKLHEFRRLRIPISKKKTPLDLFLQNLNVETARIFLDQMTVQEEKMDTPI
jgi:hypothetical protein